MKNDSIDRLVLAQIELDARCSIAEIAKSIGTKEHLVRRTIQRLTTRRLIAPIVSVDLARIGFREFGVYLSLSSPSSKAERAFLGRCIDSDRVTMILELGGEYSYLIVIAARDAQEVVECLAQLSADSEVRIEEKRVVATLSVVDYGVKVLHLGRRRTNSIEVGHHLEGLILDDADHKLLRAVTADPGGAISSYARVLGAPSSSVSYRLNNLMKRGVLCAFRYIVFSQDHHIHSYKITFAVTSRSRSVESKLKSFFEKHACCNYFLSCLGEWDYEVGARFSSPEHAADFARELRETFPDLTRQIRTIPVFRLLKFCKYPFLTNPTGAVS